MRTTHAVSISCLLGTLALALPSAAQQPSLPAKPVIQAMTEKARQLFADGVKAYQQSRWADAHAAFLAAWALSKHYSIAGNLADCELKLGLYREAAEHFARYVREMGKDAGSTPQERKDGDARFAQARAKVGQAEVRVSVPGAELYLDGKLLGTVPLEEPIFLDPGPHAFEARSDGYPPARTTITAIAGAVQLVDLTLIRSVGEPPVPAKPEAWKPPTALLVTGGALAAVGLAAGIGLTVAANGKRASADALRVKLGGGAPVCAGTPAPSVASDCTAFAGDAASRDALSKGAVAGFVLGGAFGLATAGLGWWAASPPKGDRRASASVRVAPFAGANGGGLTAVGKW